MAYTVWNGRHQCGDMIRAATKLRAALTLPHVFLSRLSVTYLDTVLPVKSRIIVVCHASIIWLKILGKNYSRTVRYRSHATCIVVRGYHMIHENRGKPAFYSTDMIDPVRPIPDTAHASPSTATPTSSPCAAQRLPPSFTEPIRVTARRGDGGRGPRRSKKNYITPRVRTALADPREATFFPERVR